MDVDTTSAERSPLLRTAAGSNGSVPRYTGVTSSALSNGAVGAPRLNRQTSVDSLQHDSITLTWRDVTAYVIPDNKTRCCACCHGNAADTEADTDCKQILHNVSGIAKPGQLLAILGASGAGKTTLLNVLNQRNISHLSVEGNLCVNGLRVGDASAIASVSGYVQQDDLFVGTLTPAEHLWFQAMLRMDRHLSIAERTDKVDELVHELGLTSCANTLIGTPPRIQGISGGERKRLAFASEALTNPSLLFCDEPTSGLDSFMAENVVSCLKKLAARGKTVICTIHQPSSQVYAMFDRVLLMAEGRVAYFGPTSEICDFFLKVDSVCPPNFNPADFYIHELAIVPARQTECKQFVQNVCSTYEKSPQFVEVLSEINSTEDLYHCDDIVIGNLKGRSAYKSSRWRQFVVVLWRSWLTNKRDPVLLRARIMQTIIVALLFGLIYLRQTYDQKGVMNINGSLFLLQSQMTFGTLFAVLNTFPLEYPVFIREHHNAMYRICVYYICKLFAEMPVFLAMPIIFTAITYWMIGLYNDVISFLIATAALLLVANVAVSFGYLISCSTSRVTLALSLAPVITVPLMLFGGFFLNNGSVPVYFVWLKYISWFTYSNEIMVVNQWRSVTSISCEYSPLNSTESSAKCFANGKEVISSLSYSEDNLLQDFLILIGQLVAFRLLSYFLLYVRSRKRE